MKYVSANRGSDGTRVREEPGDTSSVLEKVLLNSNSVV